MPYQHTEVLNLTRAHALKKKLWCTALHSSELPSLYLGVLVFDF